ncbi:uncharacterized protein LOC126847689 [Adelges cooleyi]|uniref:uncharacterized protein LOC126847689 n=1 Tax=Adelges cooleyi TaxID=133065 RepID=UPI00217F7620|nr:uncharacterized protein LOC126847689 [Adelges cooleyi]
MAAKSGKNPKSVPAVQSVNKSVAEMDSRKRSLPVIDDFDFYAQLAKLMILRKDDTEVASKYSTWLKALKNHTNNETKRAYVKLLVMSLQHPESVCPFNEYPPAVIDPLDCTLMDKAITIIQSADPSCKGVVLNPPVISAVSEDRCQYAASQVVPKVGIQCYYARADYPLSDWNFSYASTKPPKPMHASPLDWERSLAGIFRKPISTASGNAYNIDTISTMTAESKHVKFALKDANEACKIINVLFPESIDLGTNVFKWNDKSLLTGESIPGTELCIDWMVHEHEKTQLEIDEDILRSFDKLYPGNFRLIANPELLEGIYKKLQCASENLNWMDNQCKKNEAPPPRQCAGNDQGPVLKYFRQVKRSHWDIDFMSTEQPEESITDLSEMDDTKELNDCKISPADSLVSLRFTPTKKMEEAESRLTSTDLTPTILSFAEAAKFFNAVANKAEITIKEVNNWVKDKEKQK